jgi:hypothetical protein
MPTEWLVIVVVALIALLVAANVARRAADHGDPRPGVRSPRRAARRGPIGAAVDLIDASVAAYVVRDRLGRSTATRAERQAAAEKAALIERADEIRRLRTSAHGPGPTPPIERR